MMYVPAKDYAVSLLPEKEVEGVVMVLGWSAQYSTAAVGWQSIKYKTITD